MEINCGSNLVRLDRSVPEVVPIVSTPSAGNGRLMAMHKTIEIHDHSRRWIVGFGAGRFGKLVPDSKVDVAAGR